VETKAGKVMVAEVEGVVATTRLNCPMISLTSKAQSGL